MKIIYTQSRYRACVPQPNKDDGYITQHFPTYKEAVIWQNKIGIMEWGYRRWILILEGKLTRMRKRGHSVNVNATVESYELSTGSIVEYKAFRVYWRERGIARAKQFSHRGWGTLYNAEVEANLFAAKLRAVHIGSDLNLPHFNFDNEYARSQTPININR
ncbi:MAG: hypothetical protein ABJG42_24535 [Vibrio splendidus]